MKYPPPPLDDILDEMRNKILNIKEKLNKDDIQLILNLFPNIPIYNTSKEIEYKTANKLFKSIYKNSIEYTNSLSKEDIKYIIDFTTITTHRNGILITHDSLNNYLDGKMKDQDIIYITEDNKKDIYPQRKAIRYYDKWAYNLSNIIRNSPKSSDDFHVYRGVSSGVYEYIFNKLKLGDKEIITRFTSTTILPRITLNFISNEVINPKYKGKTILEYNKIKGKKEKYFVELKNPCCVLDIIIPKGTPIFYINKKLGKFDEYEILLPCNSILIYTGKSSIMNIKGPDGIVKVKIYTFIYRGSLPYKRKF